MEKWEILDENMKKTGKSIYYNENLNDGEYHLSIHVWIKNEDNNYLIQKRAKKMRKFPNMWSVITGGVVEGERGIDAALRETKEEIGINLNENNMKKLGIVKRKYDFVEIWGVTEKIELDKLILQTSEVSEVKLVSKLEIEEMIKEGLIAGSIVNEFNKYIIGENKWM